MIIWLSIWGLCVRYNPSGDGLKLDILDEGNISQSGVRGSGIYENYQNIYVESATEIMDNSFLGCVSLIQINLPDTITYIGIGAFEGCVNLKKFEFPRKVTKIFDRTFCNCKNLKSIYINSKIEFIDVQFTFAQCTSLSVFNISRENKNYTTDDLLQFLMSYDRKTLYAGPVGLNKIPSTIQTIAPFCFHDRGIISVEFPEDSDLRTIQNKGFRSCTMGNLVLPSKLEYIGSFILDFCGLDILFLPSSLTYVDEAFLSGATLNGISFDNKTSKVFMDINGVVYNRNMTLIYYISSEATELTVPIEVTTISGSRIRASKKLLAVDVKDGNSEYSSFDGILYDNKTEVLLACPGGKTTATVPESCKIIAGFAGTLIERITVLGCNLEEIQSFGLCSNLVYLNLPPSLQKIHSYCFESCAKLKMNYTFTSNLTLINDYAFYGTKSIEAIDISQCTQIKSLGQQTFLKCGFKKLVLHSQITDIKYMSLNGAANLQSIDLPDLKSLGSSAFGGCKSLVSVTIGEGITALPDDLFSGCSRLSSFRVPDSVKEIKSNVFRGCEALADITFGDDSNLQKINPNFINGCKSLSVFTIPRDVDSVMLDAFASSVGLQSIFVHESNRFFQSWEGILMKGSVLYAFPGGREKCVINGSVTKINAHAFYQCSLLASVIFNEDSPVKAIEDSTFYGCSNLSELRLPERLENVSAGAFNGCSSIESISFGSGACLRALGSSVFEGCKSLKSVDLGNDCKIVEIPVNAFKGCISLFEINMGQNVAALSNSAFEGCENLSISKIPITVQIIGSKCFNGCKLIKSIEIPSNVTSIGALAFGNCQNLEMIKYCGITSITLDVFAGCPASFAYVSVNYSGTNFGGIQCLKLLDIDCAMPTPAFTFDAREGIGSIELLQLILHDSFGGIEGG